jgi:hypothetical protein
MIKSAAETAATPSQRLGWRRRCRGEDRRRSRGGMAAARWGAVTCAAHLPVYTVVAGDRGQVSGGIEAG